MKQVRKAVFPVAGLGTRFLPATKVMPKEMLPVVDKPLIQYAVEEARSAGIEQFIFVISKGKSLLEDHFDLSPELMQTLAARNKQAEIEIAKATTLRPGQLATVRQPEPKGLGHAIWCARELVGDEPFAILLPDDLVDARIPCLKQMMDVYEEKGGSIVAVQDVPREQTSRYGILKTGRENGPLVEVDGLIEKPRPEEAPSTLSIIGRYILQPEIFRHLDKQQPGAGGEIQITDAMIPMTGAGQFHGYRFTGTRYDCGDKIGFLEATLALAAKHPRLGDQARGVIRKAALGA
ncbi:MAG TPA: UTP--glucose-1-phosphate uridylyltransferase GalU [Dongiaceae bacterium]|jgi:UTP--glucose-1-phosphate uridylyltransferase|nr:UTP--glucose-1-phosphate uridylyltransferase GalU [Dongiaceae bacterium]